MGEVIENIRTFATPIDDYTYTFGMQFKYIETLFTSPYLVATPQGYTKHYYSGSERIASAIGLGGLEIIDQPLTLENTESWHHKKDVMYEHMYGLIVHCLHKDFDIAQNGLHILHNMTVACSSSVSLYFYHPDHLGSTSWITDRNGDAIQYLHYLPFGEEWIDQRSTSWNAQYSFTGKIKDAETGYNYFGARYYDSGLSVWLSVDPLSDKYPTLSPYTYCANNPIMMVDPDGRFIMIGSLKYTVGMNTTSGFEGKVITALNDLCTSSTLARTMITSLANNSEYILNIVPGVEDKYLPNSLHHTDGDENYSKGEGGIITMNENTQGFLVQSVSGLYNSEVKADFSIALLHEISHAFHHSMGTLKYGETSFGMKGKIYNYELQATNDENQVRSEMGHKVFRTYYSMYLDPQTGRYFPSGPCLINIDRDSGVISSSDPNLTTPLIYYKPKRRQK